MISLKERLFEMMEKINPDFKSGKPKFIIPIGISGSGKSTWVNSLANQGFVVVSPDAIRKELSGDISDQTRNGEVFTIANQRSVDALNNGDNVIFDATNVKSKDRRNLLNHLKDNVSIEFNAYAKIFDSNPDISNMRISKDIENGVDRSNVLPADINRQYQAYLANIDKVEEDGYTIIQ